MAVDTRNKRASCLGVALAALLVLPAPDGAVGTDDRAHLAAAYPGLDASVVLLEDVIVATVDSRMPARAVASRLPVRSVTGAVTRDVVSRLARRAVASRMPTRDVELP